MAKRYGLDNPLMRFMDGVSDVIFLSIFWVVGCIPVLTIGASTTALYYAAMRSIRGEGSAAKDFFKSYRENLKQAVLVELIILVLAIFLYAAIRAAASLEGGAAAILHVLSVFLLFLGVIVSNYLFPTLSRFDVSIPDLFRNAFFISVSNFPYTVAITILNLIPLIVFAIWPSGFMRILLLMLFLVPGLIARINSAMLIRVFLKYEPQDKSDDPPNTDG